MDAALSERSLFEAVGERVESPVGDCDAKARIEQPTVFSNSPPLCLSAGELGCVPESKSDVEAKLLRLARMWLSVPELVESDELVERRFDEWVQHVPESAGTRDALWEDFWASWEEAAFELGADIVGMALELAERLELPQTIKLKTSIQRKILLVFVALQRLKGRGTVYLSPHDAGKHFGIRPATASWLIVNKLESPGLLQCVRRGIPRVRCTRYRVSPDVMASVRERSPDENESEPTMEAGAVETGEEVFV